MAKKKTYNVYVNEITNEFKNTKKNEVFNVNLNQNSQIIKSGKGTDILSLKGVTSLDDLIFSKEGKNLIVSDNNAQAVIIQNYFTNTAGNATKSSIKKIRLDVVETTDIGTVMSTKDYNILSESLINYDPVITKRSKKGLIKGTNFNDTIMGSVKADKIKGGLGNDIIYSGAGNDKLYGGKGADTFIFDTYSKVNPVTGITEYYGSGADKIYDATSVDTLQFTTSKISNLTFTKSKKNLVIKYFDVDDEGNKSTKENSVTLVNYYKQKAANRLTKIVALNQYGKLVEYNLNEVNSKTFTDTNTEKPDGYATTIIIGTTEGETEKTLKDTTDRDQLVFEKSTFKGCNFYKKGDDLLIEYKDETVENGKTGMVTVEDYFKEDGKIKIDAFVDMNGLTHSLTDAKIVNKEIIMLVNSSNENIFWGREGNNLISVCLNEDPYKRAIYENNTITTYENYFTDDSDTTLGLYTSDGETVHIIDSENMKTVERYGSEHLNEHSMLNIKNKDQMIIFVDTETEATGLDGINNSLIFVQEYATVTFVENSNNNEIVASKTFVETVFDRDLGISTASSNNTIYSKKADISYYGYNNVCYGTEQNDFFYVSTDYPGSNNMLCGGSGNDTYCVDLVHNFDAEKVMVKTIINDTSGNDTLYVGNYAYDANIFFDVTLDENSKGIIGADLIITAEDFTNQSVRPEYGVLIENYFTQSGKIETVKKTDWYAGESVQDTKTLSTSIIRATIASEVASWLSNNNYTDTMSVFTKENNETDIQALLAVYANKSANAWQ